MIDETATLERAYRVRLRLKPALGTFGNMCIRIFRIMSALLLAGGLALFLYFGYLSYVYAVHGTSIKNAIHVVPLNWHGDVSWISEKQSERLKIILFTSIEIFLLGVIMDMVRKHLISKVSGTDGR